MTPDQKPEGARPFTYVTEYRKADGLYGGYVEALTLTEAQRIADQRGLGEKVIGILGAVVTSDGQIMEDERVV